MQAESYVETIENWSCDASHKRIRYVQQMQAESCAENHKRNVSQKYI